MFLLWPSVKGPSSVLEMDILLAECLYSGKSTQCSFQDPSHVANHPRPSHAASRRWWPRWLYLRCRMSSITASTVRDPQTAKQSNTVPSKLMKISTFYFFLGSFPGWRSGGCSPDQRILPRVAPYILSVSVCHRVILVISIAEHNF